MGVPEKVGQGMILIASTKSFIFKFPGENGLPSDLDLERLIISSFQ